MDGFGEHGGGGEDAEEGGAGEDDAGEHGVDLEVVVEDVGGDSPEAGGGEGVGEVGVGEDEAEYVLGEFFVGVVADEGAVDLGEFGGEKPSSAAAGFEG